MRKQKIFQVIYSILFSMCLSSLDVLFHITNFQWNFKLLGRISESLQWNYKLLERISESLQWNYKPPGKISESSSGIINP